MKKAFFTVHNANCHASIADPLMRPLLAGELGKVATEAFGMTVRDEVAYLDEMPADETDQTCFYVLAEIDHPDGSIGGLMAMLYSEGFSAAVRNSLGKDVPFELTLRLRQDGLKAAPMPTEGMLTVIEDRSVPYRVD